MCVELIDFIVLRKVNFKDEYCTKYSSNALK